MDNQIVVSPMKEQDIPQIAEIWNDSFEPCYHVSRNILRKKITEDRDLFQAGTLVCRDEDRVVGFLVAKTADNDLPDYQNSAWLSSLCVAKDYRGRGLGTLMYRKAEDELKKAGVKKIMAAGEINNFFSGIPSPAPQQTLFFTKNGFQLNESVHYDLVNDVAMIDFDHLTVPMNHSDEFVTRPLTVCDIPALERFFDNEFPGRWKYEIMGYIKNGGDLNRVLVLCSAREVKGFCKIFASQKSSDEFTAQLGEYWGALGPIGIARDIRGMGLGNRLLCDALKYLKEAGARNVNIDWTALKGFYGQFGFTPWRTYLGAYKEII